VIVRACAPCPLRAPHDQAARKGLNDGRNSPSHWSRTDEAAGTVRQATESLRRTAAWFCGDHGVEIRTAWWVGHGIRAEGC